MRVQKLRVKMNISIGILLAIIFMTLKLCHVINWSWFLVLLPLYINFLLIIVVISAVMVWQVFRA